MRALKVGTITGGATVEEDSHDEPSFVSQKYRCVLRLDSGGMAEVFLAVSQGVAGFNKLFVLKRLRESLAENQEHRDMFLHEARLAARLNHPNVVQTYEVGEDGGGIFIAMEYLEGQPLSRLRREIAKQELAVAHGIHVRIVSELLSGLHYAHELTDYDGTPLRIVHRDVSPQNVFVTYDGQVKIVDFGIAKTHDSGTQAGIFKGKFAYTAPEQLRGEAIDRRADVFTAGIVLWELLTGHKLLGGDSPAQTIARLLNQPLPTVRSIAPTVDPRLDEIVMRALERNPSSRYQSAQEMRDALEEFLVASGESVRQDQVARLVGDLFRTERTRVQQAIKDELASHHAHSSSRVVAAPRLSANAANDDSISLRAHGSLPVLRAGDDASSMHAANAPRPGATRKRSVYAVAAGVAVCAIAWAATRTNDRVPSPLPSKPPVETVVAPPPTTAAPSSTIAPAAPSPSVEAGVAASTDASKPSPTKWLPHPKKTSASSAASATPSIAATPAPAPAPAPPPPAEASAKEKRKFRTEF